MNIVSYVLVVGSLMCAQVHTHLDIAFAVSVLGRYLSNPGQRHWIGAKKVMIYLQGTNNYMLTYRQSNDLIYIGYSNSDFISCLNDKNSMTRYVFMLVGGVVSWKSVK